MTPMFSESILAAAVAGEQFAAEMRAIVKRLNEAAPYVPASGDVLAYDIGYGKHNGAIVVLVAPNGDPASDPYPGWFAWHETNKQVSVVFPTQTWYRYLRPATPAERVAAGLDAPPASPPAEKGEVDDEERMNAARSFGVDHSCPVKNPEGGNNMNAYIAGWLAAKRSAK